MTSGARPSTAAVLDAVLAGVPDVARYLHEADTAAWDAVDPVLLELCRLRVAMLLGCQAELAARTPAAVDAGLDEATVAELSHWPTSPRFGARERACLAFTEQFVIDVANLSDDLADAVRDQLGPTGLMDFTNALLVVEQRQRLRLAWEQLGLADAS
jgi:alkylhydroperoxidase family enzyme